MEANNNLFNLSSMLNTERMSQVQTGAGISTKVSDTLNPTASHKEAVTPQTHSTVNIGAEERISLLSRMEGEGDTNTMLSLAIEEANKEMAPTSFRLSYRIHDETNRIMISVLDSETDEVLREVPPESSLDAVARIMEFAGLIFDKRG